MPSLPVHAPLRACAFAWCALAWSSRALASPQGGANNTARDYEPLGADEYAEEQGGRDDDAFGATTLVPPVPSDPAAASPAPDASPSFADSDLASRPLVETYPPEVMLSVDDPAYSPGDWLLGRATYFDAPAAWKATFTRQVFGDLHGNGCGYVDKGPGAESNEDFPFPLDAVAAVADFDPRFHEAACGSCYEVRCVTGPILWDFDQTKVLYPRDPPGFFEVDPDARDSEGRKTPARNAAKFPGSNDEVEYTRCWNDTASVFVTIVDTCPCVYSWGEQRVCCGPIPHFDLSFWAAERLAHPIQGKQMLRFRPVDCATREPVDARLGAVARMRTRRATSRDGVLTSGGGNGQRVASFRGGGGGGDGRREIAVYEDAPSVGWSWSAYKDKRTKLSSLGRGANGTSAACFEVSPGGRLAMHCVGCEATAKPFASAREIRFWIRSRDCEGDPTDEPPVYLGVATRSVRDYATGTTPGEIACGWKTNVWTHVESSTTDSNCGRVARVPTRSFGCGGTAAARANALFFELGQSATRERELCVDDVRILS